jgi:hypothetical protein
MREGPLGCKDAWAGAPDAHDGQRKISGESATARRQNECKKDREGTVDKRIDLTIQQREAVEAEIARRTLAHRRRVERLKRGARLRAETSEAAAPQPLDFLAIGDSWFDYPLNGNDPSFGNTDIIAQLTQLGSPPPIVLNYALYGQATTSVLTYENQENIVSQVQDSGNWVNGAPDGILVSMGGDDLAGDQFAIYLDYEGSGLDATRFAGALASVRASYLDLFALRNAVLPGKPVIGHCYDYAIPNGVGTLCAGPWLQPSLEFSGYYDLTEGLAIVSAMIDGFYAMVSALAADKANNFVLVDTRGTLQRVSGAADGWANELHPYPAGFALLAQKMLSALPAQSSAGSV